LKEKIEGKKEEEEEVSSYQTILRQRDDFGN
jgi:hypothetical protein